VTLTLGMVTIDSADPAPLARWWAEQLGGTIEQENDGWYLMVSVPGLGQMVCFQKVPDPTPGKNRVHLDLTAPDLEAETDRLVEAGAGLVERREMGGFHWTVLTDPDGNEFCVSAVPG
jgi:predicted enzyme related to lactoylglutathione lyase